MASPWFELKSLPTKVEIGDYLELHDTAAALASATYGITNIDGYLLQLDASISPSSTTPWAMTQDAPAPYGRVKKRKLDDYQILKGQIDILNALPQANVDSYYAELNRLLNPVLINKTPKASDIAAVTSKLVGLATFFSNMTLALSAYTAPYEEKVDTLISAFKQQGAQRAVDLLLEGSFSTFFGLSQDEASYAGTIQSSIRTINQQDLPQSKLNRSNPHSGMLIDSYEEPDFEYDYRDVVNERDVPIP